MVVSDLQGYPRSVTLRYLKANMPLPISD